ncbi:unnamed protein product [Closterium sp. Yama58-4]|nr:unnamed protein product [Closterium sp. Yama58-4]
MRSPRPRSPEPDDEARNPGNNLYVTGLSMRTTEVELEKHFSKEGKVAECRLVLDPRTKESRGFAFVTMENIDDARRCLKYLDRSILEGRVITVALAKRKRARTPTPGKFLGTRSLKETVVAGGDRGYGGDREFNPRRSSPDYQPYRRDRSPDYGPYRGAAAVSHVAAISNDAQDEERLIGWKGESFNSTREEDPSQRQWIELISWEPRAFLFHNFLTAKECLYLIHKAAPNMVKSTVVDSDSGGSYSSKIRTSSGSFLSRGSDEVVTSIEKRISDFSHLPVDHGEAIHVLHYEPSQEYQAHFDYFHDDINTRNGGQRLATVLMYLSDVEEGGETVFPAAELTPDNIHSPIPPDSELSQCAKGMLAVKPKRGDALLFWNLKPDTTLDPKSLHVDVSPAGTALAVKLLHSIRNAFTRCYCTGCEAQEGGRTDVLEPQAQYSQTKEPASWMPSYSWKQMERHQVDSCTTSAWTILIYSSRQHPTTPRAGMAGVGGAFGGSRSLQPVPPEKGVFPLDHFGECKEVMREYMDCLKQHGNQSDKCRDIAKKYLQCRMDRNLMAPQNLSELGFDSTPATGEASTAGRATAGQQSTESPAAAGAVEDGSSNTTNRREARGFIAGINPR